MSYPLHSENEDVVTSDYAIQVTCSVAEAGKKFHPSGQLPVFYTWKPAPLFLYTFPFPQPHLNFTFCKLYYEDPTDSRPFNTHP